MRRKIWKRISVIALTVICAVSLIATVEIVSGVGAVFAQAAEIVDSGTCGEKLTWTLDSEGVFTISGEGEMFDYKKGATPWYASKALIKTIQVKENVTSIGDGAFYFSRNLTNIELPETLTRIGNSAFSDCNAVTGIEFPAGLTSIGDSAFSRCTGLSSIELPEGLTSFGDCVFDYCDGLTGITVDSENQTYDSRNNCNAIIKTDSNELILGCQNTVIPNNVTSIGNYAFRGCISLTSLELPEGLTSIGSYAFRRCVSLKSINFPESLTSIGDNAFNECISLTSIELPKGLTSLADFVFAYCGGLTSIKLPTGLTSIGQYALYYCNSLTSIDIPASVTSIGDLAFFGCSSLTSIDIPASVTSIGVSVFYNCESLTSITIPKSVTYIGYNAVGMYYSNMSKTYKPIEGFIIYGIAGTTAEEYANKNGITFIDNHEHVAVDDPEVPATCTEPGKTAGAHCELCGTVLTEQEEIPATGHTWDNGKVTTPATCTKEGVKTFTCTVCGETRTERIAKIDHTYDTKTSKATLSKNGSIVTKCLECGNVKSSTTILKPVVTLNKTAFTYNGSAQKPSVTVKDSSGKKIATSNYNVTFTNKNSKTVGSYKVTVTFKDSKYAGSKSWTYKITQAANPLKVKVSNKTYKATALKKNKATFTIGATGNQGTLSYVPNTAAKNAKITVTSKGVVTVPKGCKAGTYKITVKAAGNKNYKAGSKTVTITIK